mmetsp:Transcript_44167/g.73539  ORF Transcript_44167/g.73539 Transcript_44167/m.73539 type:complete len:282 (+) Transcript_44167:265-1110(+)
MGSNTLPSSRKMISEMEVEEKEELFQQMVQDKINLVKQMEKDLDAIRFQAHQTTAPKKHALELLRRKIEDLSHEESGIRKRVFEKRRELKAEEDLLTAKEEQKVALCGELEKLVYFEVEARYQNLEKLSERLSTMGIDNDQQAKGRSQEAATASTSQLQSQLEAAAKLKSTLESTTTLETFLESTESTFPHPLFADEAEAIDLLTLEASRANKVISKPKKAAPPLLKANSADALAAKSAHVQLPPGLKKPKPAATPASAPAVSPRMSLKSSGADPNNFVGF